MSSRPTSSARRRPRTRQCKSRRPGTCAILCEPTGAATRTTQRSSNCLKARAWGLGARGLCRFWGALERGVLHFIHVSTLRSMTHPGVVRCRNRRSMLVSQAPYACVHRHGALFLMIATRSERVVRRPPATPSAGGDGPPESTPNSRPPGRRCAMSRSPGPSADHVSCVDWGGRQPPHLPVAVDGLCPQMTAAIVRRAGAATAHLAILSAARTVWM